MISNLPPGAAKDPKAPYNEEDVKYLDFEGNCGSDECHNCGYYGTVDDLNRCEECYFQNPDIDESEE